MSIRRRFLPHTVVVAEPTTTVNAYGTEVPSFAAGVEVRAFIQPAGGAEALNDRDAVTTRLTMFTNGPVTARARVTWDGDTYEVDGPPLRWDTPSGTTHYQSVLRLVEG